VLAALKRLNPALLKAAYHQALAEVLLTDVAKTTLQLNEVSRQKTDHSVRFLT